MSETKKMIWKGSNNELIQNNVYKVTIENSKIIKAELNGNVITVLGNDQIISADKWIEFTNITKFETISENEGKKYVLYN
jgi:hypothetical protein